MCEAYHTIFFWSLWGRQPLTPVDTAYMDSEGLAIATAPHAPLKEHSKQLEVNIAKHRLLLINDLETADIFITSAYDANGFLSDANGCDGKFR